MHTHAVIHTDLNTVHHQTNSQTSSHTHTDTHTDTHTCVRTHAHMSTRACTHSHLLAFTVISAKVTSPPAAEDNYITCECDICHFPDNRPPTAPPSATVTHYIEY